MDKNEDFGYSKEVLEDKTATEEKPSKSPQEIVDALFISLTEEEKEKLKPIAKSFDEAWKEIAPRIDHDGINEAIANLQRDMDAIKSQIQDESIGRHR